MKTNELTLEQKRQRKFLLTLPLLVIPFLTFCFWSLGGGRNKTDKTEAVDIKGFNTRLPGAKLKDQSVLNKTSYYSQAEKDSGKIREQQKQDPYVHAGNISDTGGLHFPFQRKQWPGLDAKNNASVNEAQIYQRLAQLQQLISKPQPVLQTPQYAQKAIQETQKQAIAKISSDPDLEQMNGLLEKILDIQHPERVAQKAKQDQQNDTTRFKAIPAVIDGTQKILQGSVVRIRLLDSLTIKGQHIPKGQLVFAAGNLYNQRMALVIKTIRIGYIILPVDLTVYDMTDGLEGISVPEAITMNAMKDGADNGVQSMQFMSLDESVGTQAATAGINAAKSLFSKKAKRIKAKLKNGHPLLLRLGGQRQ
jgi:hypothetical protein